MSVAFKNAMVGGVILLLIEGVSVVVTAMQMRYQYQMMDRMHKEELEKMQAAMYRKERNLDNPWAVDFNETLSKETTKQSEKLVDKAKSFTF